MHKQSATLIDILSGGPIGKSLHEYSTGVSMSKKEAKKTQGDECHPLSSTHTIERHALEGALPHARKAPSINVSKRPYVALVSNVHRTILPIERATS